MAAIGGNWVCGREASPGGRRATPCVEGRPSARKRRGRSQRSGRWRRAAESGRSRFVVSSVTAVRLRDGDADATPYVFRWRIPERRRAVRLIAGPQVARATRRGRLRESRVGARRRLGSGGRMDRGALAVRRAFSQPVDRDRHRQHQERRGERAPGAMAVSPGGILTREVHGRESSRDGGARHPALLDCRKLAVERPQVRPAHGPGAPRLSEIKAVSTLSLRSFPDHAGWSDARVSQRRSISACVL